MNNIGIEIRLGDEDDFLKIKETLTRIGVASKRDKTLTQSVILLHKQSKYYLVHFKSMFILDGKEADVTEDDLGRRNTIAKLIEDWGLCKIVNADEIKSPRSSLSSIKIIPFKEKSGWNLVSKYTVGKK